MLYVELVLYTEGCWAHYIINVIKVWYTFNVLAHLDVNVDTCIHVRCVFLHCEVQVHRRFKKLLIDLAGNLQMKFMIFI